MSRIEELVAGISLVHRDMSVEGVVIEPAPVQGFHDCCLQVARGLGRQPVALSGLMRCAFYKNGEASVALIQG